MAKEPIGQWPALCLSDDVILSYRTVKGQADTHMNDLIRRAKY